MSLISIIVLLSITIHLNFPDVHIFAGNQQTTWSQFDQSHFIIGMCFVSIITFPYISRFILESFRIYIIIIYVKQICHISSFHIWYVTFMPWWQTLSHLDCLTRFFRVTPWTEKRVELAGECTCGLPHVRQVILSLLLERTRKQLEN